MRHFIVPALALTLAFHAHGDPGHSANGEAFNEGPRQAAVFIPGCGDAVNFPISSKNPDAQKFFTQGIGQLHGFWYYEAERSFRQVAALDPECAMAYWGMSMANVNNEKRASAFIKKATPLKAKATPREKKWIATLENLYRENDKRDKKQKSLDCIKDFETLAQDDPKDIEAKAFLVWRIWFSRDEAPMSSLQAVDALIDQIFAAIPNHPAHHYRIHLWDQSKPILALKSGANCGQAAPGIAHMWHMPGHTFSKLKRPDDAAWQQEASTRVDHAYMIRTYILPDQIHNYAHNEEWLTRTYNDLGRAKDAAALATSLIAIPRHPTYNNLEKPSTSASYGRTRLIETLLKWEHWEEVKAFTQAPVGVAAHDITRFRALGIASYQLGDSVALAAALKELEGVSTAAPKEPEAKATDANAKTADTNVAKTKTSASKPAGPKTEGKAMTESQNAASKPNAKTAGADTSAKKKTPRPEVKAKAAGVAELKALVALSTKDGSMRRGETHKLLSDLKVLDEMPKERLARYWLTFDDKVQAAELTKKFTADLVGLATKTEVLQACGKTEEAKKAFEETRKLAFAMDRDLPIAKRLDTLAKTFGIQNDWPAPAPKRTDSGTRPDIASLGPVHWHAPDAPVFEALTLENQPVKSSDFTSKKPTLFLFYLGHDCGHCVEQMQAFAKAAADFDKAGIQLVAVTLETPQAAAGIRAKLNLKPDQPLPFPILSDSSLESFKKVRAHDDFENENLHATILIDTKGQQRWQDISWEPFKDAKFALEESKRLLQLDRPSVSTAQAGE
ncbi:redoxin domain-containing protein [Prosthecobacter sp.]|uniref:peroxiredoxin family protein n=1 Tax=Prosthecobacter sp. TaxID=1965333 RepID=UPI002488444B|nr:redoxin domain-containing protein [Prosthecobacter sp.]MDI1310542.1 redoxin domain-containing protein [Prosthecobacter sp.]